jgi:phenylacetic acid degradation operon negative regulatory protein
MLTLLGGMALGLSASPNQYFHTFRKIRKEWGKIDQRNFNRSIRRLSREKLIEERILPDGSFRLELTKKGKQQAKIQSLMGNSINFKKPKTWDGHWRIVMFDIPEKDRLFRDILREHLRALHFFKLQHSVFVSPYPFEKPILELVALYGSEPYVRVITALKIDNEVKIKRHFFKPV